MATIDKLNYLNETKQLIKESLNSNFNSGITDETTFRNYVDKIDSLYDEWPKVTGEGTSVTLSNTKEGKMKIDLKASVISQNTTTGKQLLDLKDGTYTNNGITATVSNGEITLNGTDSNGNNNFMNLPLNTNINWINNETYAISLNNPSSIGGSSIVDNDRCTFRINSGGQLDVYFSSINSTKVEVIDKTDMLSNLISIRTGAGITYNNFKIKPMIEKNTQISDYEPYTGGTASPNPDYPQEIHTVTGNNTVTAAGVNYPINLGTIELCKIGNYQDYIYKNNGKWYKHSKLSKYTFDGAENFVIQNNNKRIFVGTANNQGRFEAPINEHYERNEIMYCNKLKQVTAGNTWDGVQGISYDAVNDPSSLSGIDIAINGLTTAEQYRTAITGLIVYYVKQQATDTEITDTTLISQLEALNNAKSGDSTTTITQTNADLPFILSASALMKGSV